MSDKELIDMIANVWIINGGDEDGFVWCWDKIRNRIKEIKSAEIK